MPLRHQDHGSLGDKAAVETPRDHVISHEHWLLKTVLNHAYSCPYFKAKYAVNRGEDPAKMASDFISLLAIDFTIKIEYT